MIGREIAGRYRILAKLGEGGMGAVFRAEQISLKRKVALKLLKPELSAEPGLVRRFNAEAELAAKLNHPNTVTLYDFGQCSDGALFIAMEFIEGDSLREVMHKSGPVPATRVLAICEQVCSSLSDAHRHGIVHRDLKPDNIMLSERGKLKDVVRVLDFGIAKLRDEQGDVTQMPMTRAGDLLGTPQYMAPEQIRGEKVDARTDVYALGAMMYEAITGRLPFEGPTLMAILSMHLTALPERPRQRRPELQIPEQLDQLIMECLQKQPAARPPSMDAVAETIAVIRKALESSPSANTHAPASTATPSGSQSGYPAPSMHSLPPGVPRRATPAPGALQGIPQAMGAVGGQPGAVGGQPGQPQTPAPGQPSLANTQPNTPPPVGTPPHLGAGAAQPAGAYAPPGVHPPPGHPPHGQPTPVPVPHPGGRTIPTGAAAPQHAAHAAAPTPQQYVPTHPVGPRKSRAWLWAVLALVVAGGAGTGIYIASRSGGDEVATSSSSDDDKKPDEAKDDVNNKNPDEPDQPSEPDQPNETPGKGSVTGDFTTGGDRDFYGGTGENGGSGEPAPTLSGERFSSPLGYSFVVPTGFSTNTQGLLSVFVGTHTGTEYVIAVAGMDVTGQSFGAAEIREVGTSMAAEAGGKLIRTGTKQVQGKSRPSGEFEVPSQGTKAEYVLYLDGNLAVVIAVATAKRHYRRAAAFRNEIFNRRLVLP